MTEKIRKTWIRTVTTSKEMLRVRNLSTTGTNAEMIRRLSETDPSESWLEEAARIQGNVPDSTRISNQQRNSRAYQRNLDLGLNSQELDFIKRERNFLIRELDFSRRENDLLRNTPRPEP